MRTALFLAGLLSTGVVAQAAPYDLGETWGGLNEVLGGAEDLAGGVARTAAAGIPIEPAFLYGVLILMLLRIIAPMAQAWVNDKADAKRHSREEAAREADHKRRIELMREERGPPA